MCKGKCIKEVYAEKYDPKNKGLRAVYDFIYKHEVKTYGIKSNMVAVSGESINTYMTSYIPEVIGKIGKAVIMEIHIPRLRRLKKRLKSSKLKYKKRIKLLAGNIIGYESNPIVNKFIKTPARFLDLGLGIGIKDLTHMGRLMLYGQQKVFKRNKKKVIILDAARRGVSDFKCIKYLNSFLEPINQRITHVNGIKVLKGKSLFKQGIPFNSDLPRSGQPQRHKVTLKGKSGRETSITMYTYMNGSAMLTVVLKYK